MKTNAKDTLKKLGLGASAFACLMSMGMHISAKDGTTTVTYDNRNIVEGEEGADGIVKWGVVIPTTIKLSDDTSGVTSMVQVVGMNNYELDTTYKELSIKASVASENGYELNGATTSSVGQYSLQAEGNADVFVSNKTSQEFTSTLGVGTNSTTFQQNVKEVKLTAKLKNSSSLEQDEYTDKLTFTFTQEKADENS